MLMCAVVRPDENFRRGPGPGRHPWWAEDRPHDADRAHRRRQPAEAAAQGPGGGHHWLRDRARQECRRGRDGASVSQEGAPDPERLMPSGPPWGRGVRLPWPAGKSTATGRAAAGAAPRTGEHRTHRRPPCDGDRGEEPHPRPATASCNHATAPQKIGHYLIYVRTDLIGLCVRRGPSATTDHSDAHRGVVRAHRGSNSRRTTWRSR